MWFWKRKLAGIVPQGPSTRDMIRFLQLQGNWNLALSQFRHGRYPAALFSSPPPPVHSPLILVTLPLFKIGLVPQQTVHVIIIFFRRISLFTHHSLTSYFMNSSFGLWLRDNGLFMFLYLLALNKYRDSERLLLKKSSRSCVSGGNSCLSQLRRHGWNF